MNTSSVFNCLESFTSVSDEFNWVSISSFDYDAFLPSVTGNTDKIMLYIYIYIYMYIYIYT